MGWKLSLATRMKMSAAHKGKKCGPMSEEQRAKLSALAKGRRHSLEARAKMSATRLGKKHTRKHTAMMGNGNPSKRPEVRAKISAAKMGHAVSLEARAKVGAAQRAREHAQFTPETRARISASKSGSRNPNWMGGISREPYGWEWNAELREEVRRRDGYRCQLCGAPQAECKRKLPVHHINYGKRDNDPLNLITLCNRCHTRTNTRRKYWAAVFQGITQTCSTRKM